MEKLRRERPSAVLANAACRQSRNQNSFTNGTLDSFNKGTLPVQYSGEYRVHRGVNMGVPRKSPSPTKGAAQAAEDQERSRIEQRQALASLMEHTQTDSWPYCLDVFKPHVDTVAEEDSAEVSPNDTKPKGPAGIALRYIKRLQVEMLRHNEDHGHSILGRVTTTVDLANQIVKPATDTEKCPPGQQKYADLQIAGAQEARCFVSHAWGSSAADLLATIIAHGDAEVAKGLAEPVYFVDVASVDQHVTDQAAGVYAMPFEDLRTTFEDQIKACKEMLVVASPLHATRAWCLFEVALAARNGVAIKVALPPSQAEPLQARIQNGGEKGGQYRAENGGEKGGGGRDDLISTMLSADSSRAQSSVEEDCDNIRWVVEEDIEGGYQAVDAIYSEMVRAWAPGLLAAMLASYPTKSEDAAQFAHNAGSILGNAGDLARAAEFKNKSLAIKLEMLGDGHQDVGDAYNDLGSLHMAQGDFVKAAQFHSKDLAIKLKELGPGHPKVGAAYNNLASAYAGQGDFSEAIELFTKGLAIQNTVLCKDHPDLAQSYNNLGAVHTSQGNYAKAIELHTQGLRVSLRLYGPDHPDVALAYSNLASAYSGVGEYDTCIAFLNKTLEIQSSVLGLAHPAVADTYSNLGVAYRSRGDPGTAIDLHNKSLAVQLDTLDKDHPDIAESYSNIAAAYESQGDHQTAIEYYTKSLTQNLNLYGNNHPQVAAEFNKLGQACIGNKSINQAIEFYNKALDIMVSTLGPEHTEVADAYHDLGHAHGTHGRHGNAIKCYTKGLAIKVNAHGSRHADVSDSYSYLAKAHGKQGDHDKAIELHERALNLRILLHGDDHPDVGKSYTDLGHALHKNEDFSRAIDVFSKALDMLPRNHPALKEADRGLRRAKKNVMTFSTSAMAAAMDKDKARHTSKVQLARDSIRIGHPEHPQLHSFMRRSSKVSAIPETSTPKHI